MTAAEDPELWQWQVVQNAQQQQLQRWEKLEQQQGYNPN